MAFPSTKAEAPRAVIVLSDIGYTVNPMATPTRWEQRRLRQLETIEQRNSERKNLYSETTTMTVYPQPTLPPKRAVRMTWRIKPDFWIAVRYFE